MVARVALRAFACTALAAAPVAAMARDADAHPLHTSLAQLAYDPAAQTAAVSLRVFADDFAAAVARSGSGNAAASATPPDSAVFRYVASRFVLWDRAGRSVPLRWCGARRVGDLMFVCLQAPAGWSPAGARVGSALLADVFDDQVNIVQATYDGQRQTLLFTRGDGPKRLP